MNIRLGTQIAALLLGIGLGVTGSAGATTAPTTTHPPGFPVLNHRACENRIDTNCDVWTFQGEFLTRVQYRYVKADATFCVNYSSGVTRCETYWPFRNPVINPNMK